MFTSYKKDKFKYDKWEVIINEDNKVSFKRKCLTDSTGTFDAYIYYEKPEHSKRYRCEHPVYFRINNKKKDDRLFFIKQLKNFDSLVECVTYIDLALREELGAEIVAPFIFKWYKDEE